MTAISDFLDEVGDSLVPDEHRIDKLLVKGKAIRGRKVLSGMLMACSLHKKEKIMKNSDPQLVAVFRDYLFFKKQKIKWISKLVKVFDITISEEVDIITFCKNNKCMILEPAFRARMRGQLRKSSSLMMKYIINYVCNRAADKCNR